MADLTQPQDLSGEQDPQAAIASQGFGQLGQQAYQALDNPSVANAPMEGVEPEGSPVDLAVAGVAAKAAPTITDAIEQGLSHLEFGELVGNEVGQLGEGAATKKIAQTPIDALKAQEEALAHKKELFDKLTTDKKYWQSNDPNRMSVGKEGVNLKNKISKTGLTKEESGRAVEGPAKPAPVKPTPPVKETPQEKADRLFKGIRMADGGEVAEAPSTPDFIPDHEFTPDAPTQQAHGAGQESPDFIPDDQFQSDEDKYGTLGQEAKAGLEGVGQGLLGPIAPAIEQGLGVKAEDIRGRAEQSPWIHGAGEIAGLVAPALATAGGSLLERAGIQGAAEALPAAAKFTQLGALDAIQAKLGITAGETLASKIGVGAAKASIDNMLLSGSDEVSKMILQDPNQSAQTAMVNVGLSGALGGLLGGGASGASKLWEATVGDKTSKIVNDFKARVQEHMDNPDPVNAMTEELKKYHSDVTGVADDVYGAQGLKAQDINKAMPEMHEGITEQAQGTYDLVNDKLKDMISNPDVYPPRLAKKLQGDVTAYTNKISDPNVTSGDIFNATQDLKQSLQGYAKFDRFVKPVDEAYDFVNTSKSLAKDLRTSLEDTDVWGDAAKRQQTINKAFTEYLPALKDFEKKFTTEQLGEKVIDPTKINTYLNQLGKPQAELKQSMLQNFLDASEKYKKVIGQTHANLGIESPISDSPMNVTMSSLDKKTLGSKLADAFIKKGLTDTGSQALGAATGAGIAGVLGLNHGIGAIVGQHALGPFYKSVLPGIANAMFTKEVSSVGAHAAIDYAGSVAAGDKALIKASDALFKSDKDILPESLKPNERTRATLMKQLNQVQKDPESLMKNADPLQHYLPDHSSSTNQTVGNAVTYLNSIRPDVAQKLPLDGKPVPTLAQKQHYNNALDLAEQPLMILEKAKKGTLTNEDLATVTHLYPYLLNNVRQKVTESLTSHIQKGNVVPYKTRLGLSALLGQPLDSSMTPSSIVAAQIAPPEAPQQDRQPAKKGTKSAPALQKMSNMYQTPEQARDVRKNKD